MRAKISINKIVRIFWINFQKLLLLGVVFFMKRNAVAGVLKRLVIIVFCVFALFSGLIAPISLKQTPTYSCSTISVSSSIPKLSDIIKKLFKRDDSANESREKVFVYVGGYPLGFTISCSGVIVVAKSNDTAKDICEGDIITKIEGKSVSSAEEILMILNSPENAAKKLKVQFIHKGEVKQTEITPIYDSVLQMFKLGIWIRDNSAGVGTLTYIRKDNKRFGALGHPVCDIDTGCLMPVGSGNIFRCNIVGYKRGVKGNPGELKGLFLRNGSVLGSLDKNNGFGVYGTFDDKFATVYGGEVMEVAKSSEVKSGKAKIRCTIDGTTPKDYDIEIVRAYFQKEKDNKSMFIRVTDSELISKTGGIVQGMSGSPIIQNGKLVGAVTHVFVSDPTKGYGVYADYMIGN